MPGPVDDSKVSPELIFAGMLGATVGACVGALLAFKLAKPR
jgi:hypothetical protein